ncbi:hypothetical protein BC827DRAFT_956689 [Russula dissimulans]|nr:hypothetical protein BC827DRAFT_956689 [Russula dissimulans]
MRCSCMTRRARLRARTTCGSCRRAVVSRRAMSMRCWSACDTRTARWRSSWRCSRWRGGCATRRCSSGCRSRGVRASSSNALSRKVKAFFFRRHPRLTTRGPSPTVSSKPLPLDVDVFKNIDLSLRDILAAYQSLDGFWVAEVQNLSQAIETVHVDRVRVERWLGYKDTLKESISKWKGVGALTNENRIENVQVDGEPETPVASDLTAIEKQLRPQMMTAGCPLHTMRDHVSSADMAPIQVAIFGLPSSNA